jgi:predicted ribosome quality control (RQC) complex YloA/Tae2 family protein
MTLDGLTLYAINEELKNIIVGAKVEKVFQPLKDEIVISLRTKTKSVRLLISTNAGGCRMGLTEYPKKNPMKPPTFCMFLRKHLQSARISIIEQLGLERITDIHFDTKDELGISKKVILVCELMGKYSNVILKDESGKILESLRHVPFGMSSVRQVLPGMAYELPPSDKYNPFLVSKETFFEMTTNIGNKPMDRFLVERFQGVSSHTAHEIKARYLVGDFCDLSRGDKSRFIEDCIGFFSRVKNIDLDYTIQFDKDDVPKFFSVMPYQTCTYEKAQSFESANLMVDAYYKYKFLSENFKKQKTTLDRYIRKALKKHYKKLKIQSEALDSAKKADNFKLNGDLIMANIYALKKRMDKVTLTDYTTGELKEITLDKKLSPSANAQKFYKRYNKLKKGMLVHAKNIVGTKSEIDFLESVQMSLQTCETFEELSEVKYELVKADYISIKPGTKPVKATQDVSKPHAFVSTDGLTIYAGKNNRQNDLLTIKTAEQTDLWLHTQKIPGCHVIVKMTDAEIPDQTLIEAATIAAYYSKAKTSSKVPVDYTLKKNLRKPNGSSPGFVVYETYHTIIVDPDEAIIEKLKKR